MMVLSRSIPLAAMLPISALALAPVTLPTSEPTEPALLFGAADVAGFAARKTDPLYSPHYSSFKGFVNGQLAGLASNAGAINDDTLTKLAKGAALLHVLGETPPASFASYRDAAVAALKEVGSRSPGNPLLPPSDAIDPLQDSPRLQSMIEAYDMLHGAGVSSGDDGVIRGIIADWAEALRGDLNLTGAFGVPGHRDNWGIKSGAALVSCALGMSTHVKARDWLSFGMTLLNESFAKVGGASGWFRESPHYLNYSLGNLFTTAVEVQRRTGVDWFAELAPFAKLALDMRQPDGYSTPFEEGVSVVFPYDLFAGRLPGLDAQMAWAWTNSAKDSSNFENQAIHSVTRFLLLQNVASEAPKLAPTRFQDNGDQIHVLRSSWAADALQVTAITAVDHAATTLVTSRHNMQNPLDFTVAGAGRLVVATSGGGPQVTSSANRNYYLTPSSRNLPLVGGNAPFTTDPGNFVGDLRLDSVDAGPRANHYADLGRTTVSAYTGARSVKRLWLMLDDSSAFVADEFLADIPADFASALHPRGTRTVRSTGPFADASWLFQGVTTDVQATSNAALTLATTSGFYGPTFGTEEAIQGVELRTRSQASRVLTRIAARSTGDAPAVEKVDAGDGAAIRITTGNTMDLVIFGTGAGKITAGDIGCDAILCAVRRVDGKLKAFAVGGGKSLEVAGAKVFEAAVPTTMSTTLADDGLALTTSRDTSTTFSILGLLPAGGWSARDANGPMPAAAFAQVDTTLNFRAVPKGTTLRLEASQPPTMEPIAASTVKEGETLQIKLIASDPDGTPLAWSATGLPAGATIDASTGEITWTPGFDVATLAAPAVVTVKVTASDGSLSVSGDAVITVENVNRPPIIGPEATLTLRVGETLSLAMSPSDPDGDATTVRVETTPTATPAPEFTGGKLSWKPAAAGSFVLKVIVSDSALEASVLVQVTVRAANRPPVIRNLGDHPVTTETLPLTLVLGGRLAFTADVTDPDGDALTCKLVLDGAAALPKGCGFDANQRVFGWSPSDDQAGSYAFTLACVDPDGLAAQARFTVEVKAKGTGPNGEVVSEGGCACDAGSAGALALFAVLVRRRRITRG